MSNQHDHHSAPPNPYLQPRRSPEEVAALEQRVAAMENLLIEKGFVSKTLSTNSSICTRTTWVP